MTAQRGKDLLLKISDGNDPQIFQTVAGLRTRTLSLNTQSVDITHAQSAGGWRELLAGSGVKQASVSGAGVFLNDASANKMRSLFFGGDIVVWQIIIPGFGSITGLFQITNLDYAGEFDGEASFSLALESAGQLEFLAEILE